MIGVPGEKRDSRAEAIFKYWLEFSGGRYQATDTKISMDPQAE